MQALYSDLLKSSAVGSALGICVLLLLIVFGRRIPAALRHCLLLLAVLRLMLIALPVSLLSWENFVTSSVSVSSTAESSIEPAVSLEAPEAAPNSAVVATATPQGHNPDTQALAAAIQQLEPQIRSITLTSWLPTVWLAGFGATCLLILTSALRLRKILRLGQPPASDHPIGALLRAASNEAGVRSIPRLLFTDAACFSSPALTGIFKPTILFPRDLAENLDAADVYFILLHELAHLKRRDVLSNAFLLVVQAVHWFNPFAWFLCHRIRVEAERAADAWVLKINKNDSRQAYGNALINLLQQVPECRTNNPVVIGVMERKQDLSARIAAIASFHPRRRWWCIAASLLIASLFAALGLTQAPGRDAEMNDYEIDIRVVDEAGKAVPSAAVKVRGYVRFGDKDGKILLETTTDNNGALQKTLSAPLDWIAVQVTASGGDLLGGRQYINKKQEAPFRKDIAPSFHELIRTLPLYPTSESPIQILSDDEFPIKGLKLWVRCYRSNDDPKYADEITTRATTDDQGRCSVSLPVGHRIMIQHNRKDLTNIPHMGPPPQTATKGELLTFRLKPAYTVRGSFTLPDGTPVVGANISGHSSGAGTGETDAQGRFEIHHFEATKNRVTVRLPAELRDDWICPDQTITVSSETPVTILNLVAKPAGVIQVRFIDATSDEVVSTVAHRRIDPESTQIYISQLKLPEGYRHLDDKDPKFSFGDKTEIVLDARITPITPENEDNIYGRVIDGNGAPIMGARVFISPKKFPGAILTDDDGRFSHAFKSGYLDFLKNAKIYADHRGMNSATFQWPSGSKKEVILTIEPRPPGSLRGRIVDESGDPIVDADVVLLSLRFQEYRTTTKTKAKGEYQFVDAHPIGEVVVLAKHPAYSEDDYRGGYQGKKWLPLNLESGQSIEVPDITLRLANKSITGRVVDAKGDPVERASVMTQRTSGQPERRVITDGNGKFKLAGLLDGWIEVRAQEKSEWGVSPWRTYRFRSGANDVELALPDRIKPYFYSSDGLDFTGKQAPPIVAKQWINTSNPPSLEHRGKTRFVMLLALGSSTRYMSKLFRQLQQLSEEHSDIKFIIVHGDAPPEQVEERLKKFTTDFELTIPIAIEPFLGSMSETIQWMTRGALLVDGEGKVLFQSKDYKKAFEFLQKTKGL